MSVWCERVIDASGVRDGVRYRLDARGAVTAVEIGVEPRGSDLVLGTALPGSANAHSHAFHRVLRGRTHADGGDFWQWRDKMYAAAAALTPERYQALARAVFAEMLVTGYTAVGEFHYVHHRPDGEPYPFAMEDALISAAESVGIRLTLLDAAYLAGGVARPLGPQQRRFGDGDARGYLDRWNALARRHRGVGAALHSVRAVPPEAIVEIAGELPPDVPLHIHLSEQPQENADSLAAYGASPTQILFDAGVLDERMSVVHATHLTDEDIALLGAAEVTVVMCPTTEADLGDGIGPAHRLAADGARIALGSDQNAVVDPFLEMRGLEMQERLRSGLRGRFSPADVLSASTVNGYRSLGHRIGPLNVGGPCDLVEVRTSSVRTVGARPDQLVFVATGTDVARVVVGGRVVADTGKLTSGEDPAEIMAEALAALQ
ncbi:formimidoylglutamate deiminase [Microbacterium sp. BR1]|uniref:formimidoylglutamate deiminase n=1 Tax=Microbacterium sp. BR1 TaxID=1070896 RepID=UPI001E6517A5|nr:formimidoylglutamate deiminase [Microbacterium sp. BR1]